MTERVSVVRHEAAAAAAAAVDGLAAVFAGSGDDMGFVIVRQRRRDVLNVTIPTDGALADGITGAGTGGSHGIDLIAVFALGRCPSASSRPQREHSSSSLPSVSQMASRMTMLCHA